MAAPLKTTITFPGGTSVQLRLAQVQQAIHDGCVDAGNQAMAMGVRLAKTTLSDYKRVDRGTLRNSITGSVSVVGHSVTTEINAGAFYAQWVEYGRYGWASAPWAGELVPGKSATYGFPNLTAIQQWVRRNWAKLGVTRTTRKYKGKTRQVRGTDKQINAVAFLIARKIARVGIRPTPFMRPMAAKVGPLLPTLVINAVQARLVRAAGNKP